MDKALPASVIRMAHPVVWALRANPGDGGETRLSPQENRPILRLYIQSFPCGFR